MPEYVLASDLAVVGQEDVKTGAEAFDGTGFSQEDIETGAEAFGLTGFGQDEGIPPWTRTPLYALEGMGQVKSDPKVIAGEIRRLLDPKIVVPFVAKRMKEQAEMFRQKHTLMEKQLREAGLLPAGGMGHVMSTWEATKTGEGPWYNPGATHNKKHETGEFVILKNYSVGDIALVKGRGMSDWEVQHLHPDLFEVHLKAAKAGIPAPPGTEPLESPSDSATEALQESVGGQLIVHGETAVEVAKRVAAAAADAAKKGLGFFTKVLPYLPYIGVGVVGLIALPYVFSAVKAAKGLKASLTPTRGTP